MQPFLVGFLNFDPLHEQDGEWGFTRAQQGFIEGFRIPRKVYILKDGMRGGMFIAPEDDSVMIMFFLKSNKKTWVEKKKHAAFGEDFLVTANWVEAFFLPPYTSQMEFNWSAYTSPVSKLQHSGGPLLRGNALFLEESWDNVFRVWVQMIDLKVEITKMPRSQQIDVFFSTSFEFLSHGFWYILVQIWWGGVKPTSPVTNL